MSLARESDSYVDLVVLLHMIGHVAFAWFSHSLTLDEIWQFVNCSASYTGNEWVIGHRLHSSYIYVYVPGLVAPILQSKRERWPIPTDSLPAGRQHFRAIPFPLYPCRHHHLWSPLRPWSSCRVIVPTSKPKRRSWSIGNCKKDVRIYLKSHMRSFGEL